MEANFTGYKCFRNVYGQGLMWGLPMPTFFIFALLSIVLLFIEGLLAWVGLWYVSILLLTMDFMGFFITKGLVRRYGPFFFDKLMAHHFSHTFSFVRNNQPLRTYLQIK